MKVMDVRLCISADEHTDGPFTYITLRGVNKKQSMGDYHEQAII